MSSGAWFLWCVIIGIVAIIQIIMIYRLNVSRRWLRMRNHLLKQNESRLKQRVIERTEKWHSANERLEQTMSQHQLTESLLAETKEYLNNIINSMPSVVIGVTPQNFITHWNRAAELYSGVPEMQALGHRLDEILDRPPVSIEVIQSAIEHGLPQTQEAVAQGEPPEVRYSDITVYPLLSHDLKGAVIRLDDVTLRVRVENMMIQNEKMLSLGELAAGMAHEINNPLAAILQSLQNIQRRFSPDNNKNQEVANECGLDLHHVQSYMQKREISRFIDGMRDAGERAAQIVRNMLDFSHTSGEKLAPSDLHAVLHNSLEFTRNAIDMNSPELTPLLQMEEDYDPAVPAIPCSPNELQQVIVNLLRNAAHALSEVRDLRAEQGVPLRIALRTRLRGNHVVILVEDNGTGMSQKVQRHIFDPFFTTKGVGQGTGLGLSISYFIIIERHHGAINVESTEGEGTRFIITLPVKQDDYQAG